ncbi:RNA polymerase Rpc34 [Eremomyces bilateralis CBS 781.70]|uniref:RNA polymerase Rpc34 n=1 Tax=Eremomyces bilateralis CBS 781.70 TaxID=1392243 RepID=A0A6G1GF54_9PEZI|nr:RNA polymerase Rpc34 [Eremomyces bilateralis CBS 781.70]KAF1816698.1 RNA polymerase Rpc34 [Eremomyces bilateralis CBS 781.70]
MGEPSAAAGALYDACMEAEEPGHYFYQDDLLGLGLTTNVEALQKLCSELTRTQRFRIYTSEGRPCWRSRGEREARKLVLLADSDRMVYECIEAAGRNGIWAKTIKSKTNLHQMAMNKALKALENGSLIKEMKSAKTPMRKNYILFDLEPSEENTGGRFYTDGEMDVSLIDTMSQILLYFVSAKSWAEKVPSPAEKAAPAVKKPPGKRTRNDVEADSNSADFEMEDTGHYVPVPFRKGNSRPTGFCVPHPHGYAGYPTIPEILKAVRESGVFTADLVLSEEGIQQLLDALVYDGQLEIMKIPARTFAAGSMNTSRAGSSISADTAGLSNPGISKRRRQADPDEDLEEMAVKSVRRSRPTIGYRTTRPLLRPGPHGSAYRVDALGSGYTEAPCGRCPVFEMCVSGGLVSPETCVYFEKWLGLKDEDNEDEQRVADGLGGEEWVPPRKKGKEGNKRAKIAIGYD